MYSVLLPTVLNFTTICRAVTLIGTLPYEQIGCDLGCMRSECPALVPNVQTGSQNMLSTVPLLSTTSRSSALSWALCPFSFGSVVFKLGAKRSDGHQCRAPSLNVALMYLLYSRSPSLPAVWFHYNDRQYMFTLYSHIMFPWILPSRNL